MKSFRLLLVLPLFVMACSKNTPEAAPAMQVTGRQNINGNPGPVTPGPTVTVQALAFGYSKAGQCIRGKGKCAIAYSDEPSTLMTPRVQVSVHDGKIDLLNLTPSDPGNNTFSLTAEDEFYVDVHVANDLGYNSIKVLKGDYSVDTSRGEYGGLLLNAEMTNF